MTELTCCVEGCGSFLHVLFIINIHVATQSCITTCESEDIVVVVVGMRSTTTNMHIDT